jgi:hypothetical protein
LLACESEAHIRRFLLLLIRISPDPCVKSLWSDNGPADHPDQKNCGGRPIESELNREQHHYRQQNHGHRPARATPKALVRYGVTVILFCQR